MASGAFSIAFVLAIIAVASAQRRIPGMPDPVGPVTPSVPGVRPGPVAPIAKPPPKYASESSINFNWGYLTIRAGCCLRDLGACKKNVADCQDAPDQGTWREALGMWTAAGNTWVDTCTAKGAQPMAKGCPAAKAPFVSEGPRYSPAANTWVQYWLAKRSDFFSVNALLQNSLLDVRYDKMWLHQSVLQFMDGFMYIASDAALGLNETNVYMEDSVQDGMGAAAIGVRAKVGAIKSGIVLNNSVFGWNTGKIWLIQSSFKQYKGAFIVENTSFWFESSQMSFWDMPQGHVARTTWNLTNSQLNLVRSTIRVWDSTIILSGSHINLNESRLLLSNTQVIGDNFVFSTVNISDTFGVTIQSALDQLNVDFKVEEEDGKIVLKAKEQPKGAANGR